MGRTLQCRNGEEMSIRRIRSSDWLKLAASVCALIAIVAAVACIGRSGDDGSDGDLDEYFLRDVATVEAMGLPLYWLGTEFTVDGLVFRGPHGAEFGAEVEGGIHMSYRLVGGNSTLDLTVYSRDAWARAEDRVRNPGLPGVTHRTVTVGGREAELISIPLGTRPVNTLWLVLDLGDVVVLATAGAGGVVYPGGPDYNPFINNPDLLIQVMEDLRPYPE
jgi:hypothetical protein